MAKGNMAIVFGGLLAGGVVIDYGVKAFKSGVSVASSAVSGGGGATSSGGSATATGPLPKVSGKVSGTLTGSANSAMTSAQKAFATNLAADTGLNINVVAAWMKAEQPWGSASAPNGTNNWLNIGSTDAGFYGGSNPAWTNPVSAAHETAYWLSGRSIDGYGAPSSGIQNILQTAGQAPEDQIHAIQSSGWASTGYPQLGEVYNDIVGGS